ncbi:MAG: (d)CMP kinase [Bacilli bacterium]|nr:(d)CMP kinase [Bacilli bacterium]
MSIQIALDGPSATGKSTVAKNLSKRLNYIYIDTGAMYRAIGLFYIKNNIDYDIEENVLPHLDSLNVSLKYENGVQRIFLNDEDITDSIRTEEVSRAASVVSQYLLVREKLVSLQQEFAGRNNVIMDGRDIGTVVLPNATLKIYLTASVEERTRRRLKDYQEKGIEMDFLDVKKELEERDYRDTHRENSPLKQADDAILLDTTELSVIEVENKIVELLNKKVGNIDEKI